MQKWDQTVRTVQDNPAAPVGGILLHYGLPSSQQQDPSRMWVLGSEHCFVRKKEQHRKEMGYKLTSRRHLFKINEFAPFLAACTGRKQASGRGGVSLQPGSCITCGEGELKGPEWRAVGGPSSLGARWLERRAEAGVGTIESVGLSPCWNARCTGNSLQGDWICLQARSSHGDGGGAEMAEASVPLVPPCFLASS